MKVVKLINCILANENKIDGNDDLVLVVPVVYPLKPIASDGTELINLAAHKLANLINVVVINLVYVFNCFQLKLHLLKNSVVSNYNSLDISSSGGPIQRVVY